MLCTASCIRTTLPALSGRWTTCSRSSSTCNFLFACWLKRTIRVNLWPRGCCQDVAQSFRGAFVCCGYLTSDSMYFTLCCMCTYTLPVTHCIPYVSYVLTHCTHRATARSCSDGNMNLTAQSLGVKGRYDMLIQKVRCRKITYARTHTCIIPPPEGPFHLHIFSPQTTLVVVFLRSYGTGRALGA